MEGDEADVIERLDAELGEGWDEESEIGVFPPCFPGWRARVRRWGERGALRRCGEAEKEGEEEGWWWHAEQRRDRPFSELPKTMT